MSRNIKYNIFVVILMCLMGSAVDAQIKIGDIEITEALAKEYFFDCYAKPDTVKIYRKSHSYGNEPRFYDDLGNRYFNRETIRKKYPRGLARQQRTEQERKRGG